MFVCVCLCACACVRAFVGTLKQSRSIFDHSLVIHRSFIDHSLTHDACPFVFAWFAALQPSQTGESKHAERVCGSDKQSHHHCRPARFNRCPHCVCFCVNHSPGFNLLAFLHTHTHSHTLTHTHTHTHTLTHLPFCAEMDPQLDIHLAGYSDAILGFVAQRSEGR